MLSGRRTGFHGLPAEYRTPEGAVEDWQTTLGYLTALESCGRPIVVAVADERTTVPYIQHIGYLRRGGEWRPARAQPSFLGFRVFWPDREQLAGRLALREDLFEGATLSTNDGDDYFDLRLSFGSFAVLFLDSNVHLDDAHPERKRGLEDLPTATQIETEWSADPDNEVIRALRRETAELRDRLVKLGAKDARTLSDGEIQAAALRVLWRLKHDGTLPEVSSEHTDVWVPALARQLGASGGGDAET